MWPGRVTRMSSGPSPRLARHRWRIERSGLSRQRPAPQPKVKVLRWPSRCLRRLCPSPPVSRCPPYLLQSQQRARPRTTRRLCRAQRFGRCQPPSCCRKNQHLQTRQARNLSGAAPIPDGRRPNRRRAARRSPPCSACCVPNRPGGTSSQSQGLICCGMYSDAFEHGQILSPHREGLHDLRNRMRKAV
jgi:hypothetical protein